MYDIPQVGGVYKHWKGNTYLVMGIARDSGPGYDSQLCRKVIYLSLEDGTVYHRPLYGEDEGWCNPKVHEDGTEEEKYKYIGYSRLFTDTRGKYHVERIY